MHFMVALHGHRGNIGQRILLICGACQIPSAMNKAGFRLRRLRVQVMHEAPLVRRATPWRGSPGCGCVRFRRCGSRADLSTLYERADVSPSTLAIVLRTVPNLVEALAEVWQGAPAREISQGGRTAWQDLGRGYVELQRTRAWGEHQMFFVQLHIPRMIAPINLPSMEK